MDFLEQLGKKINDAGDSVRQKTQRLAEINSLNKLVNSNEAALQDMYKEIGRAYYEAHKDDALDVYADKCRVITEAYRNIAQLQDQIRMKKGTAQKESEPHDTAQPADNGGAPASKSEGKVCAQCGTQVPSDSSFCPVCGQRI